MGYASASREEKLKMNKTSNTRKTVRKLNKLGKKGKLSRNVVDTFRDIKQRKSTDARKRVHNIQDDWVDDRDARYNNEEEDIIPLDMMDADIDWENSAFASAKRRYDLRVGKLHGDEDSDGEDIEVKRRKFGGQLEDNMEEMLPIKLQDGTLIRPTREKAKLPEQDEEGVAEADEVEEEEEVEEDISSLTASEMMTRRKQMLEEFKKTISTHAHHLISNPQENVFKLRDLFHLCQGKKVHSLVRETVQKLAMASMVQLTDEEKQQKRKKDLKQLHDYEESFLRYYLKYLQICETFSAKFTVRGRILKEDTFSYKIGLISVKAMARLMTSCSHFNYTTNIISTMVRLSLSKTPLVVSEVCGALAALFKEDIHLKMTLFGSRSISTLVTKRKGRVPAALLATLLSMNIKEVKNEDKKSGKGRIFSQRARLKKERTNKTARKYKKQLDKLEADLIELDHEETMNDKLKNATEAMKYVFQTYFSVLKRMPNAALLEPVLEGLSKYAHLLNVEFFEDIVHTMEELIEKRSLRLLDQLHCVNTVFVILSGEGQLLNVDPSRFYRNVYRILNHLPFEIKAEQRHRQMMVMSRTLYIMLCERRKQVPVPRVAAFVKRALAVATVMDDYPALCLASVVRSLFIAHPKLTCLIEDDEGGAGAGGACRPDLDDPDIANAMGGSVRQELLMLSKRRHKSLSAFAKNIVNGVPSTGPLKISPQETSIRPWDLMNLEIEQAGGYEKVETKYLDDIKQYCLKRKQAVTPQNIQFHIANWLDSREL